MPKKKQFKVGIVRVKEIRPNVWQADWRDPLTKRRPRRIIPFVKFKDVQAEAERINREVALGHEFKGRVRGSTGHLIEEAVLEAIKHTDANEKTRRDYLARFNPFAEYLEKNMPGVRAWGDVKTGVVETYLEHCRREGMPHDTIRMRLQVLKRTASYMTRVHDYTNHLANIRLKRKDPSKAQVEAKETILSPEQMRGLWAWLGQHEPMVHVWAMLQGLCGLRIYEAAYLCEQDFDPEAGTITIAANSAHKPKTAHSYRTIPVCEPVRQALTSWIGGLKVRHPEGFIFLPSKAPTGRNKAKSAESKAGVFTYTTLSHLWRDALKRAREAEIAVPEGFTPRKLRSSFVTAMSKAGANQVILQKYVGHAPATILTAHYDEIDLERLEPIADLAADLWAAKGAFEPEKKEIKNGVVGR